MFKNYFKIAFRSLTKYKGYTLINMLGLTVGITTCILICLYIQYEVSYDRFHHRAADIYRLDNTYHWPEGDYTYPTVTAALSVAAKASLPEVQEYVRLARFTGNGFANEAIIRIEDEYFKEKDVFVVDPTVFKVFSFHLKVGNEETALQEPFSVVLTEETAHRFFRRINPVGKSFVFANDPEHEYKVTGVAENVPGNSHLKFRVLVSMATLTSLNPDNNLDNTWDTDGFYSYLLLSEDRDIAPLEKQLKELNKQHLEEPMASQVDPSLIALTDIHLHSNLRNELEPNGSITQVYIFVAIAVFILFIAIINYMNLATARSIRRAKEVGMRKALGAQRYQLIGQFLSESVLLVLLASMVSLFVAQLLLPAFNHLSDKHLSLEIFGNPVLIIGLVVVLIFTGIVSGSYPALFLSAFRPAEVLKGKQVAGINGSPLLRKGLVIFQFMISIVLIVGAWLVYSQIDYLKNKDLGFEKGHVVVIQNTDNAITPQLHAFKKELSRNSNIRGATASLSVPGGLRPIIRVKTDAMGEGEYATLAGINIDFEYLQTMGIRVEEGRNFSSGYTTDSTEAIILNRQAIQDLGLTGNPVGQVIRINMDNNDFQEKRIIGIVRDINFEPLYRKTEGAFFAPILPFYSYIFVRIAPQDREETLRYLEEQWHRFVPGQPFDYSFLDDNLNKLYRTEEKLGTIVTYFSILAVVVACLGLFGLASFATDQRRKEIGIRKVLGSSSTGIVLLFFKEYLQIILIANLIAWPLAYYLARQYMGNFVFHIDISWIVFLAAGILVCVVALLTVGTKAASVAISNPVKSLRSE